MNAARDGTLTCDVPVPGDLATLHASQGKHDRHPELAKWSCRIKSQIHDGDLPALCMDLFNELERPRHVGT